MRVILYYVDAAYAYKTHYVSTFRCKRCRMSPILLLLRNVGQIQTPIRPTIRPQGRRLSDKIGTAVQTIQEKCSALDGWSASEVFVI